MDDRTARVALGLALVPLVVGIFGLSGMIAGGSDSNAVRAACAASTLVLGICQIAIWRRYIRWSAGRVGGTIGLMLVLALQLVLWAPLWDMGCSGENDGLRSAQSSGLVGLWSAGCTLLWWGGLGVWRRARNPAEPVGRFSMSPNAVRLSIGLALVPFLPGLFWVALFAESHFLHISDDTSAWHAYTLCAVIAVAVWLLLWRRSVVWNFRALVATTVLGFVLIASPVTVMLPDSSDLFGNFNRVWEYSRDYFPLFTWALWIAGTAWFWRRPDAAVTGAVQLDALLERAVRCPQCAYNLTGLYEVRCPECGWRGTIDRLLARGLAEAFDTP